MHISVFRREKGPLKVQHSTQKGPLITVRFKQKGHLITSYRAERTFYRYAFQAETFDNCAFQAETLDNCAFHAETFDNYVPSRHTDGTFSDSSVLSSNKIRKVRKAKALPSESPICNVDWLKSDFRKCSRSADWLKSRFLSELSSRVC